MNLYHCDTVDEIRYTEDAGDGEPWGIPTWERFTAHIAAPTPGKARAVFIEAVSLWTGFDLQLEWTQVRSVRQIKKNIDTQEAQQVLYDAATGEIYIPDTPEAETWFERLAHQAYTEAQS